MNESIISINSFFIRTRLKNLFLGEILLIDKKYIGEVINVSFSENLIQLFDQNHKITLNSNIERINAKMEITLGPGILNNLFDGIQNNLEKAPLFLDKNNFFFSKLDTSKKWKFTPLKFNQEYVSSGDIVGFVDEDGFKHMIMIPENFNPGKLKNIKEGEYSLEESIGSVENQKFYLYQKINPRIRRSFSKNFKKNNFLFTNVRIIDWYYPVSEGSFVILPGGFGVGKTQLQMKFVNFIESDILIYVACGERGNEVTELISIFNKIKKEKKIKTILICNTSNMPITARELGIYVGISIAEYFRNMGYRCITFFDSLSRWMEGIREMISLKGEIPGEQGYPPNIYSLLEDFSSRFGVFLNNNKTKGSLTGFCSISPPGGDLTDLVCSKSISLCDTFLNLDTKLRDIRHFPAINWMNSFSKSEINFFEFSKRKYEQYQLWIKQILKKHQDISDLLKILNKKELSLDNLKNFEVGEFIINFFFKQKNSQYTIPFKEQFFFLILIKKIYDNFEKLIIDLENIFNICYEKKDTFKNLEEFNIFKKEITKIIDEKINKS